MHNPPLVSVIIPAYNAAGHIGRALGSVVRQDYSPLEIIVSDDASTDATVDIIRSFTGANLCFVPSPEAQPTGPGATRNRGLDIATGEYVAFLDSDDEWLPGKIARQVQFMEDHPECSMVVCDGVFLDEVDQVVDSVYRGSPPVRGPEAWRTLLSYSFIATPCVLARRGAVMQLGGFDAELRIAQDQDMWIRLALIGEVGALDERLVVIHSYQGGHMKSNAHQQVRFLLGMIERHVRDQKERLQPCETKEILGSRYAKVGRQYYTGGMPFMGFKLIGRAILWGYRPLENTFFLIHASPPGRWIKSLVR